jgi:hypothetical protein
MNLAKCQRELESVPRKLYKELQLVPMMLAKEKFDILPTTSVGF